MVWYMAESQPLIIVGHRYNRLTVIGEVDRSGSKPRVMCRCDCGKKKLLLVQNVKSGRTKSCGCLQKEMIREKTTQSFARKYQP